MYSCCSYHQEKKIEIIPLGDGERFEEDGRVDEEERVYLKVRTAQWCFDKLEI